MIDQNPCEAPQMKMTTTRMDEKPDESPKLLVAVSAIIGVLLLLQFALGKLGPLLWPDFRPTSD